MSRLTTTLPGLAKACRRAARLGVSPTTASFRSALAGHVADNDEASRDPNPRHQRFARRRLQASHRFRQRQAGADRPLRIVLVRARPAEIGEDSVTQELRDMAFVAHYFARYLRLERPRSLRPCPRGRAAVESAVESDEVAEQHGELAAFGM